MDAERFIDHCWFYSSFVPTAFSIFIFAMLFFFAIIACITYPLVLLITIWLVFSFVVSFVLYRYFSGKFFSKYAKSALFVKREMLYDEISDVDEAIGDDDDEDGDDDDEETI
jgi:membrane protein implicated in regulation of membrane protease activity